MQTEQLGRYQIKDYLGSGAYADVYRAVDTLLMRPVALKVLKPALVTDEEAFKRFTQEAQAAAGLFHPHIATVLDMGEAAGRFFLAMRYVEGVSLDKYLKEKGTLPWEEALKITREVGEALQFAHERGLVHRDVKPQNIIISRTEGAVLTDFGLVRAVEASSSLSRTGAMVGTPQYMAPEVWDGLSAQPAADQYALGCVLTEMLSGKTQFNAATPWMVMRAHMVDRNTIDLKFGAARNAVIIRSFELDPTKRYPSIASFIFALYQVESTKKPDPNQKKEQHRATQPARSGTALIVPTSPPSSKAPVNNQSGPREMLATTTQPLVASLSGKNSSTPEISSTSPRGGQAIHHNTPSQPVKKNHASLYPNAAIQKEAFSTNTSTGQIRSTQVKSVDDIGSFLTENVSKLFFVSGIEIIITLFLALFIGLAILLYPSLTPVDVGLLVICAIGLFVFPIIYVARLTDRFIFLLLGIFVAYSLIGLPIMAYLIASWFMIVVYSGINSPDIWILFIFVSLMIWTGIVTLYMLPYLSRVSRRGKK